jgi:hypothetical protein
LFSQCIWKNIVEKQKKKKFYFWKRSMMQWHFILGDTVLSLGLFQGQIIYLSKVLAIHDVNLFF